MFSRSRLDRCLFMFMIDSISCADKLSFPILCWTFLLVVLNNDQLVRIGTAAMFLLLSLYILFFLLETLRIDGREKADLDQMRTCLRFSRLCKIGEPPAYPCACLCFCYTEHEMRKLNLFKEDKVKAK